MRAGFFPCLTANQAGAGWRNTTGDTPLRPEKHRKGSVKNRYSGYQKLGTGVVRYLLQSNHEPSNARLVWEKLY